ncbi:MAG TPA: 4Fe-4S dicluster domain-containing protein [Anaeromyxobacter sp.]|nr:4Fe-4S dicluster domain-containing protein [Anaeromyxobacter sp.]
MASTLPSATWIRPPKRGRLHRSRRALQIATSLVFLLAPFVNLFRFDLRNGRIILGGTAFALGELLAVYLLILLFIVVVFAGALLYGRVYCGWMCPQTTLSEAVASFERWVCKGRKGSPVCKAAAPAASLGMAAIVAASLVTYFLDPADRLSPPRLAWISWAITTGFLFADLYFLRHRFCLGVCPYGILQNIVQDGRTLGVELDPARREECTDCLLCVRACFMGVDIREQAFNPACLNCGDCISATTLSKTCPEEPLIRFRYGTVASRWPAWLRKAGVLDVRRALVVGVTAVFAAGTVALLASRQDLDADVAALYDQAALDDGGLVHNAYRLTVANRLDHPITLRLEVSGVPGVAFADGKGEVEVGAGRRDLRDLELTAPAQALESGPHALLLRGQVEGGKSALELSTLFFVPSRR